MSEISVTTGSRSRLRSIGTIAAKDIVDGLRNKTTLTMMLGVALIMLTASALPLILSLTDRQRVLVADPTGSPALAEALRLQSGVQAGGAADAGALQAIIAEGSDATVGVALPADWATAPAGEPVEATGYVAYWVAPERATKAAAAAEAALAGALDRPVTLRLQPVYPAARPGGNPLLLGVSFVMILLLVSIMLVPLLLVEERETHTLDMLLVSPVTMPELALGKALAGLTFGLLAAALFLVFNRAYVVNWGVVLAAALLGSFFATCLGLLLGLFFENQGTLNLWVGLLLILLLAPLAVGFWPAAPAWVATLAEWQPAAGLLHLFWQALVADVDAAVLLRGGGLLLGGAMLLLALIVARLRRLDR